MCEQMGWEPDEERIPIEPSSFALEVQYALLLLNALPDRWDGMSGSWFGKDYSGLSAILDIYEVENRKEVFELLQIAESELGKHYEQKRKEQEQQSKARKGR